MVHEVHRVAKLVTFAIYRVVSIDLLDEKIRLIVQVVAKLLIAAYKLLGFIVARKLGHVVARNVLIRCQLAEGRVGPERFRML